MEKGGQGVNESNFELVEYINKKGAAGGGVTKRYTIFGLSCHR